MSNGNDAGGNARGGNKIHHASSLAVNEFNFDVDDFDTWVEYFENAVGLAHQVGDGAQKEALCIQWLPLKLDKTAKSIYKNVTERTWDAIKQQLSLLMVDPQDKYNWLTAREPIQWDGKESFHSLATRVRAKSDKYCPAAAREHDYFLKFRMALPTEYRKAIDIGCGDEWKIDKAKAIANRVRLADSDAATANGPAAAGGPTKAVAFVGASMSDDRLKSVEMALQGINVRLDNMDAKKEDKERERPRRDDRSPSRDRGRSSDRYRRDDSRGRSRDNSRDRYRAYDDRSRRDSYERQRSSRRGDEQRSPYRSPSYSRYSRERDGNRWNSRERRWDSRERRFDSRERRYDRDRRDSRDRGNNGRDYRSSGRDRQDDRRDRQDDRRDRQDDRRDDRGTNSRNEDFRSLDFNAQMDYLAAELAKRQLSGTRSEN